MPNYELLKENLNKDAKIILMLIKEDYYQYMSTEKKKVLDDLLASPEIVIVDKGLKEPDDRTLAHGGRGKNDGKIHYYPDSRQFDSEEEMLEKCRSILPHEIFHYFLQPDAINLTARTDREMANFYTEGLVEKETRRFIKNHPEISHDKATYGYNITFVNLLQGPLNAASFETIFSESDYLKDIKNFFPTYKYVTKGKERMLETIREISMELPENLRRRFKESASKMVMQDGNARELVSKLKALGIVSKKSIDRLEENDLELE